jgi:hypothetical protein
MALVLILPTLQEGQPPPLIPRSPSSFFIMVAGKASSYTSPSRNESVLFLFFFHIVHLSTLGLLTSGLNVHQAKMYSLLSFLSLSLV